MAAQLIQIYYKEEHLPSLYSFAKPHFNEGLTIFFENSVIMDYVLGTEHDKIAVCSHALRSKMKYNIRRPRELTQEVLDSDYEVLCFTGNTPRHVMLQSAERWHPGFKATMQKLLGSLGYQMPNEVKIPIYQNAFSAKGEIYKDYCKNWLKPAIYLMTNDPEMNQLIMEDSKYTQLSGNKNADDLLAKIGVPYYPMAPFILERLFSIYVHNNKIPVTWL